MDAEIIFRFFIALAVVIGLVLLAGALARRFNLTPGVASGLGRGKSRAARRLDVMEIRPVDPRRRLVLVRRDDREHLLLIGGTHDLVVETGITPPSATADTDAPATATAPADPDAAPRPAPARDDDEDRTP